MFVKHSHTSLQLVSFVCIMTITIEGREGLWFPFLVSVFSIIITGILILLYMCSIPYDVKYIRWPWAELVSGSTSASC